jgi:hypothetical protein
MAFWQDYDAAVLRGTEAAVRAIMEKHDGNFYAIAFHEFYGETGGMIGLPCLAANTLEELELNGDSKWSSPDWKWIDIKFANAEMKKLHQALEKYACSEDDDDFWEAAYKRMIKAYIRAITEVAAKLKKHKRASPDFVGIVSTEDNEIENLKKCVTPAQFKKLFPEIAAETKAAKQLQASPLDKKLAKYREALFDHEAAIIKLGAAAVPMLLEMLGDAEQGWNAAYLLGRIGIAEPRVIEALRKRMKNKKQADGQTAIALALLGDVDHVLKLAASPSTRSAAIDGLTSLYSSDVNDCQRKIQLDFRPLEKLLEIVDEKSVAASLDASSSLEITAADVSEALRGIASTHTAVREQALRIFGARRLDAKSGAKILPAVAACLADRKASVRKLALFALAEWKKAAKPYEADIRKCTKDSNAEVVYAAKHCLDEMK